MKSIITETKNKVLIESIPRLEWGKNNDISFIKSTQLALNSIGESYSYDFLMGISGAAFRFHFKIDWCPSAGDVTTGFDVSKVLFRSLGFESELFKINDNDFNDIRSLYQRIITQINLGYPIIAINLKTCPEWGIITGYLKDRPGILCRTYFDESHEYSLAEHAPWLSFFIKKKDKALNRETLLRNALEIAVQLAYTNEFESYNSGFAAIEKWIGKLRESVQNKKSKKFKEYEVNLTLFYYLLDSRQAAVEFLISMNDLLKDGNSIIDAYKKEIELLKHGQQNILPSFDSNPKDWTEGIINKQIDILSEAMAFEREAINMIQKELISKSA